MGGLEEFRQQYAGSQISAPAADEAVVNEYRGRLPEPLLEEWSISGFAGFGNGFIWLTNPTEMQYAVGEWGLDPTSLIFGRTAFGDLFIWDGKNVRALFVHDGEMNWLTDDLKMFFEFSLCDDLFLEEVVRLSKFREALDRLGAIAADEMYTYVPALALGGEESVDHLKTVKMREQLLLLSQLHRGETQ